MLGLTTFTMSPSLHPDHRNRIGIPQIKPPPTINGVFERNYSNYYGLNIEYRLENGRICMTNGCY